MDDAPVNDRLERDRDHPLAFAKAHPTPRLRHLLDRIQDPPPLQCPAP